MDLLKRIVNICIFVSPHDEVLHSRNNRTLTVKLGSWAQVVVRTAPATGVSLRPSLGEKTGAD
jgi:hypothetical protein